MFKLLRTFVIGLLVLIAALAGLLYSRYGGGKAFPGKPTAPVFASASLEEVAALDEPPGNVAVSADGRVFITIHPESKPLTNHVVELVDGKPAPFPSSEAQATLYKAPQGIRIDRQGRLWTIDHGDNGIAPARLVAIDIATRRVVHDHTFDRRIAPVLSYLQDLVISPDGATIYIADVSFFGKDPGLVVYDVASGQSRRLLTGHPAVMPQGFKVRVGDGFMQRLGGLIVLKAGLDSIALSVDGSTLYVAPMSGGDLWAVDTTSLRDAALGPAALAAQVRRVAAKPLSDGASIDTAGRIYLTDVENHGVARVTPGGAPETLVNDPRIRWADGLSFGPDGWLYVADSAIPWIALKSRADVRAAAPYHVWRFKPGGEAPAGH
jgi:sugar lactone lactonase YvrE